MILLRRVWISLAFAMWCFAGTWVHYAVSPGNYFTRYEPWRAVVIPSLAWVVILTLGLLVGWEYCLRRKLTRFTVIHFLFLSIATVPVGAAAIALLGATPKVVPLALRARWFWPVAVAVCAVPVLLVLRRPRRASRLARTGLLYSWPVLLLILFAALRGSLLLAEERLCRRPFCRAAPCFPRTGRAWCGLFSTN